MISLFIEIFSNPKNFPAPYFNIKIKELFPLPLIFCNIKKFPVPACVCMHVSAGALVYMRLRSLMYVCVSMKPASSEKILFDCPA